jgi:hypothetical protein
MRLYKLMVALPFLDKGRRFLFDDDTGNVYAILDGKPSEYPLRQGLAAYLWLLMTERKYMRKVQPRKHK